MYKYHAAFHFLRNKEIVQLNDNNGVPTGHLLGIFNLSINLKKNDINPVWVFDGISNKLKESEVIFIGKSFFF